MNAKNVAVVLSGCGVFDGAEIHLTDGRVLVLDILADIIFIETHS